jgi:lipoate-protein ligase A
MVVDSYWLIHSLALLSAQAKSLRRPALLHLHRKSSSLDIKMTGKKCTGSALFMTRKRVTRSILLQLILFINKYSKSRYILIVSESVECISSSLQFEIN